MDAVGAEEPAEGHLNPAAGADLLGVSIGQLHRIATAPVEVDDGEHDGRAGGVGKAIDGGGDHRPQGVGHRDGLHVVDGTTLHGDPGRREVHRTRAAVLRTDEPELPRLVAVGGRARDPGRLGPPGGFGLELAPPGQELGVGDRSPICHLVVHGPGGPPALEGVGGPQHHGIGAVGQVHDDHGRARRCCARHGLEGRGEDEERVRRAALADAGGEVVDRDALRERRLPRQSGHGAAVHPRDDQPPDVARLEAARCEGPAEGLLAQGQIAVLAEALLPQFRDPVTRGAPAVGELVRGRGGSHELGQHPGPLPDEDGGAGVTADGLVAARGQAVALVGGDDQSGAATAERGEERADARAQRTTEVVGADLAGETEGRRHCRGVGLVQIRRLGGGEPQGVGGLPRCRTQRQPGGLDPERGGVLVVGGHRPRPLAAAAAHEGRDVDPGEPPVGHVARRTQDASHGGRA